MAESAQESTFTNRLANETSPYLLQHKNNPVDWYPWGEDALKKSKGDDKPIFLSIGYSACHWCHVMEHESFENPEIAAYLNEHFVNIKVDREERPDLDEIYMTATQLITHSGGWPMSVFLTPDLKPFYAGTYFPPQDLYNRPGFKRLIETLAETYEKRREEVETSSQNVANAITEVLASDTSAATVEKTAVFRMVESMKQRFDPVWGGFGGAPKFPHTMDLMLAMRYYRENKDEEVLHMATHSLEKMARGGMYDQLGGGFHRYSVDSEWLIPHFEKMLYDNALLSRTYLEAYQLTGNEYFAKIAREIFDYIIREMQDEEGGYYSATDADSEGEEGKFFVWNPSEIEAVLGPEDAKIFCSYYDVTEHGNFEHGKSALWIPKDPENVAKELEISLGELNQVIERSEPKLLEERSKRVPPGLDDKVLVDWNGLMISSMAFGSFVLSEPKYLESAAKAATCLLEHQWNGERLLHSRRQGESRLEGMLSDYANLAIGLIDLYEASLDLKWLEKAIHIHAAMVDRFGDPGKGGFYNTVDGQSDLLIRTKTGTDNATPSGNSVAALNALRLGALTGKTEYEEQAKKTLLFFGQGLLSQGMAYPMMMNALDYHHHGGEELVLVPADAQGVDSFLEPLRKRFAPNLVWISSAGKGIEELAPLVKGRTPVDGKATAYLCRNRTCQAPTTEPEEMLRQLR